MHQIACSKAKLSQKASRHIASAPDKAGLAKRWACRKAELAGVASLYARPSVLPSGISLETEASEPMGGRAWVVAPDQKCTFRHGCLR